MQNFGFILTLVNQTLKKPAGCQAAGGAQPPKSVKCKVNKQSKITPHESQHQRTRCRSWLLPR